MNIRDVISLRLTSTCDIILQYLFPPTHTHTESAQYLVLIASTLTILYDNLKKVLSLY